MKNILILNTGGTFSSEASGHGLAPSITGEEIKGKLGIETDPTEEQIMTILKDVVSATNEKLESYKKIKNTVLRMTEFEKNTSKKIKRY